MKVTKLYKIRHKPTGLYLGKDSLTKEGKVFKIYPEYFSKKEINLRIPNFHIKKFPELEKYRTNGYIFTIPQKDWELEIYEPKLIETRSYEK